MIHPLSLACPLCEEDKCNQIAMHPRGSSTEHDWRPVCYMCPKCFSFVVARYNVTNQDFMRHCEGCSRVFRSSDPFSNVMGVPTVSNNTFIPSDLQISTLQLKAKCSNHDQNDTCFVTQDGSNKTYEVQLIPLTDDTVRGTIENQKRTVIPEMEQKIREDREIDEQRSLQPFLPSFHREQMTIDDDVESIVSDNYWACVVFTKNVHGNGVPGFYVKMIDAADVRDYNDFLRDTLTSARRGERGWRRMNTRTNDTMMQSGALLLTDPYVLLPSGTEYNLDIASSQNDFSLTPESIDFSCLILIGVCTQNQCTMYAVDYVEHKVVRDLSEALDNLERPVRTVSSRSTDPSLSRVAVMSRKVAENHGHVIASFTRNDNAPRTIAEFLHNPNRGSYPTHLRCVHVHDA